MARTAGQADRRAQMAFALRKYTAPDFSQEPFISAPEAVIREAPKDAVAPEQYHAMSIYPEYFRIGEQWLLAEDGLRSRL